METNEKKLKGIRDLRHNLRQALKKMPDTETRMQVLKSIEKTNSLLGFMQEQKHLTRLYIWECTYYFIDFLRQNGQLGREQFGFDDDVKKFMDTALFDLMYEVKFKMRDEE